MAHDRNDQAYDLKFERMRLVFSYYAIGSICAAGLAVFLFLLYEIVASGQLPKLIAIVLDHPQAAIGGPVCMLCALLIVLLLRTTEGPIQFEAFGLKFRGASGPIIMWILCFGALVFGLRWLWPNAAGSGGG